MATLSTTLRLVDHMSNPLRNLTRSITRAQGSMQQMDRAARNAFNGSTSSIRGIGNVYVQINNTINQAANSQRQLNNAIRQGTSNSNTLLSSLKNIAAAYLSIQSAQKLVSQSDEYTSNMARLNLIKADGEDIENTYDKIYRAAQRATAPVSDMMNNVSKLAITAKDAFSGTDEVIYFSELMAKQFAISGASASEASNAMYQLTQAMASNRLQGDEFRSIMENAPLLVESIRNYLGVTRAELRKMASNGEITADVIKGAMFKIADDINDQFGSIPLRFSDLWTLITNNIQVGLVPVYKQLGKLWNNEGFRSFLNVITVGFIAILKSVVATFNAIGNMVKMLRPIAPIILGILTPLLAYKSALIAAWTWTKAIAIGKAIWGAVSTAIGAARIIVLAFTNAQKAATLATALFNAAWLSNPVVAAIEAIIAAIGIAAAYAFYMADSFDDAIGRIMSGIYAAGAFIYNVFVGTFNAILARADVFLNALIGAWELFLNLFSGGFSNSAGAIANSFGQLISTMLGILKPFVWVWDAVFGTTGVDTIKQWQDTAVNWGKNDKAITLERDLLTNRYAMGSVSYEDMMGKGYDVGKQLGEGLKDKFYEISSPLTKFDPNGLEQLVSGIANNTDRTAQAAEQAVDKLYSDDGEMEILRAMAEREAINRFTTAEVKVDFTANNSINSSLDIGYIIEELERQLSSAMHSAAEGAY